MDRDVGLGEKKKRDSKNSLNFTFCTFDNRNCMYGMLVGIDVCSGCTNIISELLYEQFVDFSGNLSSQAVFSRDKIYAHTHLPHRFCFFSKKGWVCVKSFKTLCFLYENFQYHFGLHLNWSFETPRRPVLYHIRAFSREREEKYLWKKIENFGKLTKYLAILDFSLLVDVLAISCCRRELRINK